SSCPSIALRAATAWLLSAKVTKPNPRDRPVSLSFTTTASTTSPKLANASLKPSSSTAHGRPPTNTLADMLLSRSYRRTLFVRTLCASRVLLRESTREREERRLAEVAEFSLPRTSAKRPQKLGDRHRERAFAETSRAACGTL